MFREIDARTAVNKLIDGNEKVFVITYVNSNIKIAPLTDYPIVILSDPELKDDYRYIFDDGVVTEGVEAAESPNEWEHDERSWYIAKPVWTECNDEEIKSDPVYHSTTTMPDNEGLAYYADPAYGARNTGV